jgi:hypothetical protein
MLLLMPMVCFCSAYSVFAKVKQQNPGGLKTVKILEWVHLLETRRVSTPVFQNAIARQKQELATALLDFQQIEIEAEDQTLWLQDLKPALEGLLTALGNALTQAELYVQETRPLQIKRILSYLQEVERIEQYLQSRMVCASYLTQKQVQDFLRVASEKVETLLSME